MIALADQPLLRSEDIAALLDLFAARRDNVIIPRHDGVRGHPLILPADLARALVRAPMEISPRVWIERHKARIYWHEAEHSRFTSDMDTPQDRASLLRDESASDTQPDDDKRSKPAMKLDKKVCIVTGAASGIGLGIARRYVAEGALVALADLNLDAAANAAAQLNAEGPGQAIGIAMDVTSEEQVNAGVAQVVEKWGTVDVLVSNAGIQIVNP
ncbi:hypothetical protein E4T56_gene14289, partial [Termitomyces sp. T112]